MIDNIKEDLLLNSELVLAKVHPELAERVRNLITMLADSGYYFGAHMGLRTWDEQAALYAQGRNHISVVNELRYKAGWQPIAEWQNKKVTRACAGKSFHNYGLAADIVEDGDPENAGIQWSWASTKSYLKIGPLSKELGLAWGGFWKSFVDYPHIELTGGLSLEEARLGYLRGGLDYVWQSVSEKL